MTLLTSSAIAYSYRAMYQQFVKYHLAMSLGERFSMTKNGRTGGGGLVHPKGENSMAMSGFGCKNCSEGVGGPYISPILSMNGPRKQSSYLVGPPCSVQGQFISCKLVSIA